MDYEVRIEHAVPRPLAVARGATSRVQLGGTILKLLDSVWPVLRQQSVKTGQNVVVYLGGLDHIEAGVEVFGDFLEAGAVRHSETPAGAVVTTAHWGEALCNVPGLPAPGWCTAERAQAGRAEPGDRRRSG